MKFYTIEVDEKVWNYLKKNAEPFKDTPNSVLNRIIFGSTAKPAPKTVPPPRPYERRSEPEVHSENDLTLNGIKLELERQEEIQKKNAEHPHDISSHSHSDDIENLQLELEDTFSPDHEEINISLEPSDTFQPDKDIDDFINELEKSNTSTSIRDEFSRILKDIPRENGEWKEISVHPKMNPNIGKPSPMVRTPLREAELKKPPEKKKPKLLSLEDKLVYSLGERLKNQWGEFRQEGVGLLIFANKTVLCKSSKYDEKNAKWFWGVSQADRYAWGPQNWLALILENEDQKSYSFLLFNSQESGVLFDQCKQTTGDKYINMLIDDAYESARIQEWRHLDLRNRKKALPLFNPEDE